MSAVFAFGWAWEQHLDWPAAKLLLLRIGMATIEESACGSPLKLDELVTFSGAREDEVRAALDFLAASRLVHLTWSPTRKDVAWWPRDTITVDLAARTCEPDCPACIDENTLGPALPSWITDRVEWNRLRTVLTRQVAERDGWKCRGCGVVQDLTVDHVVPLRLGGRSELANLQVLCRPCNSTKGTRNYSP